jgi:isopentenyldiphosphate isomerase
LYTGIIFNSLFQIEGGEKILVNKNELLCVVDEYDTPLTPVARHEAFKKGLYRRTAHVWIVNGKNQVLCQKRSMKKDMGPGKWEVTVAGHIGPDDNYFSGAVREVREETGLPVTEKDLTLFKIYKDEEMREYRGVFYCKWDAEAHHITREEDEVDEVKFLHVNTLKHYLLYKKHDHWIKPGYEREMFSLLYMQSH